MKICLELKTCGGWDEMYIKYVIILFGDILVLDLSLKFFFFLVFFLSVFLVAKKTSVLVYFKHNLNKSIQAMLFSIYGFSHSQEKKNIWKFYVTKKG